MCALTLCCQTCADATLLCYVQMCHVGWLPVLHSTVVRLQQPLWCTSNCSACMHCWSVCKHANTHTFQVARRTKDRANAISTHDGISMPIHSVMPTGATKGFVLPASSKLNCYRQPNCGLCPLYTVRPVSYRRPSIILRAIFSFSVS